MGSLLHIYFRHTPWKLTGDAYLCGVSLTLHGIGTRFHGQETDYSQSGHNRDYHYDSEDKRAVFRRHGHRVIEIHILRINRILRLLYILWCIVLVHLYLITYR